MSTDTPAESFTEEDGVLYDEEVVPQHGVLSFTLRELLIVGVWLVIFVTSFFPVGWSPVLWVAGISWILPLGLPTVAVFLIVLRRFSPEGIRRVGSLGIDQFASVAFSVAVLWWAQGIWAYIAAMVQTGGEVTLWVPWVQLGGLLVLTALTVFAPLIPGIRDDFRGRLVTLAHRNANPVRPVIARARPERPTPPVAPASYSSTLDDAAGDADDQTDEIGRLGLGDSVPIASHVSAGQLGAVTGVEDSDYVPAYARTPNDQFEESEEAVIAASDDDFVDSNDDFAGANDDFVDVNGDIIDVDQTAPRATVVEPGGSQPFWALAPTERHVLDERGEPLFSIGPTAWALVIEDRGGAYVVRHDDGRVGYLHDVSDITKG